MKYLVIVVFAAVAVWYFFLRESPPPEVGVRVAPPSPQKQFQSVLEANPVDAASLAPLCEAYPQLAAQYLRNRQFMIKGVIEDFRLSGIDERRAEVLLKGGGKKRIVLVFDLDQYSRLAVDERAKGKYAIVDSELLWIPQNGATTKKVLFAKETPIQKLATTKSVGASDITFMVQGGTGSQ